MQTNLLRLISAFFRRVIVLSLVAFLCLSGLSIFTSSPVNAATEEELKLVPPDYEPSADEKIERAYELSGATGRLEEAKQQITKSDEYFDPTKKANIRTFQSEAKGSEPGLIEKAKELVEKVTK